ncbi:MAG: hypothetical protein Fur0012_04150 [Elusimicrobiota bacterium]
MKNTRKEITLRLFSKADSAISREPLFRSNEPALLAVSGGPDSMALLHYFVKKKRKAVAAHFNHSIRGAESDADEKFVEKFCMENSIPLIKGRADIPALAKARGESLEQAARKERYLFLAKTALKCGARVVCTAHHADDNTETFLLNLLRGTSLSGLAGIPLKRNLSGGIFVFRPLLAVSKSEILSYLKANGVAWREDRTNRDERYLRNWIRKTLLPMLEKKQPRIREHILSYCLKLSENQTKIR